MLLNGCEEILSVTDPALFQTGFFGVLYECISSNWLDRPRSSPPSQTNWTFRSALNFTPEPTKHFEKQLEKTIASIFALEDWGNAVPTASGLVDSRHRHMNIDLVHRIPGGFEFIELKLKANDPVTAASQALRYAAIYLLYRREPELRTLYRANEMLTARRVVFEVLAPFDYYRSKHNLKVFENFLTNELQSFCAESLPDLQIDFRYRCFPKHFEYTPGMNENAIREAVKTRHSPFQTFSLIGHGGVAIGNFEQWRQHGLPPDRAQKHWKPGRSACELGRFWTHREPLTVPKGMDVLFESDSKLKGLTFDRGFIEHETALPFSSSGPRCHDLFLRGVLTDGAPVAVSIEAKADEPFDTTVGDKVRALAQKKSNFPSRLEWLAHYLFGESAFLDFEKRVLKLNYASMPYQLLSAFGGVCVEAQTQKASHAVLIIHEFRTDLTDDTKMAFNSVALEDFLIYLWKKMDSRVKPVSTTRLRVLLKRERGNSALSNFLAAFNYGLGRLLRT